MIHEESIGQKDLKDENSINFGVAWTCLYSIKLTPKAINIRIVGIHVKMKRIPDGRSAIKVIGSPIPTI